MDVVEPKVLLPHHDHHRLMDIILLDYLLSNDSLGQSQFGVFKR